MAGESMKYALLSQEFYRKHQNHREILQKQNRPYCIIIVQINDLNVGIPFRSNITHKFAFFTDRKANEKSAAGLDYTKAVVLDLAVDIDYTRKAYIRPHDYKVLLDKKYRVEKGFAKFLNKYIQSVQNPDFPENKGILQNSSLQYFHGELGITSNNVIAKE